MRLHFYIGSLPPSVNHYWQTGKFGRRISKAGLAFRATFIAHLLEAMDKPVLLAFVPSEKYMRKLTKPEREDALVLMRNSLRARGLPYFAGPARLTLGIRGSLYADGGVPPVGSPLRPDLDNTIKAAQDCLQHFGVLDDDNQIDDLRVIREAPDTPRTSITVEEWHAPACAAPHDCGGGGGSNG